MRKSIFFAVMCCVLFCFSTVAESAVVIDLKIGHAPVRRAVEVVGKVVVKQAVRVVKVRRAVRRLIVRRVVINRLHNLVH